MNKIELERKIGNRRKGVGRYLLADSDFMKSDVTELITAAKFIRGLEEYEDSFLLVEEFEKDERFVEGTLLDLLYLKGDLLHDLGRFQEAKDHYSKVLEIEQKDFLFANRALACWELGEYSEALDGYCEAIKLNPKNAIACRGAGEMCLELDREKDAVKYFRQAIVNSRNYGAGYSGLGLAMFRIGRWAFAYRLFKKAVSLDPEDEVAHEGIQKIRAGIDSGD